MPGKALKIGLSILVLGAAIGGLLWSSLREGMEYYKHVDEVTKDMQAWQGKRLQVHGFVVKDSIERRVSSLDYRFQVQNNGAVLNATYSGVVPDTFKSEAEVVLTGTLAPDGVLHVRPDGVMAKCPSKYEAKRASLARAGS